MIRWITRSSLTALLLASLAMTWSSAREILRNPFANAMADASLDQIVAASDRAIASAATPEYLASLLLDRLNEDPRNWIAVEGIESVAAERQVTLPADLVARRSELWDQDSGYLHMAGDCARCAWDGATCTLNQAMICNMPIGLTPVGDVAGLTRAGMDWAKGDDIDDIDLALSIVGIGSTAAILASGGSSLTIKAGATTLRLARTMRLVSPRLAAILSDVAIRGIDWQLVRQFDLADPSRLVRPDVFRPMVLIATDMQRVGQVLPPAQTLHLVRYVDDAGDARKLANASEALGRKTVGRMEVLGKGRFMRTTIRTSNLAIQALAGFFGLALAMALFLSSVVQTLLIRYLRKAVRIRPTVR